ncbi:hypothetical protein EHE19_011035 [Ruminiclostridium herbifermentans]|uniref:Uncharacterized protein n=1 Tax=Ruminiclostridium herbifermentans TaxID=2488810 RepID=A0A4U7JI61_9FIRM|nr:hypothetical protein [Ruminiclostridium herbifermentans]QNU65464.1 hypothetical protein EHE19_011035 [Ruminiclostridium herbifermentans]
MTDNSLNIDNVLNIIFKTTTKSPQIFADFYLRKDISIISRWRNGTIVPKTEDLKKIAEFVLNESTEVQRLVIKNELISILRNSLLKQELKQTIINKENFEDFLIEFLSIFTIEFDLYEETKSNHPAAKKIFTPKKRSASIELENKELEQIDNQNDISGNYKGIMKFNLSIDKKGNITSNNSIKRLIRNTNQNVKDINKIKNIKYLLSKATLVIVLFSLTSFIVYQALDNKQSNIGLETAPAQSSQVVASPKQNNTVIADDKKSSDNDIPTASSPAVSSDTNSTLAKNTEVVEKKQHESPKKTSPKASSKKSAESGIKTDLNTSSKNNNKDSNNNIENSNNNINNSININGSNNNIAVGSSTIILENE